MLPDYDATDPKLERLSKEEVIDLQSKRLRAQVKHCHENTPFWRKKFDNAGITPSNIRSIEDLKKIPYCTKEELQKDQEENPPYGSYLAVDTSMLTEYFATSGTKGRPLVRVFSRRDWKRVVGKYTRTPTVSPGEVVMLMGPTDGLFGPNLIAASRSAEGALVVKASRYSTEDKIRLVHTLRPSIVTATSSFLLYIASVAAQMGMGFQKMGGVRDLLCYGEPGAALENTKRKLLEGWAAKHVLDAYGVTEMGGLLAAPCPGSGQIHIRNDFVIVEVIDTKTNEVLGPNQRGELVFTNIANETQPLLRYKSGDVARISEFGPCAACGKTLTTIMGGIEGRIDDMIWYKGINIFPTAIETVVRSFRELSDEYEIVLDQVGEVQTLTVRAEVIPQVERAEYDKLRHKLVDKLLGALEGVHAKVELLSEGTLPKAAKETGKARRVRDNRPK